jgi:cysteine desulfurase
MADRAYLDWNATAPLRPQARTAMLAALEVVGNPSSVHGEGRAARKLVEQARAEVAGLVGAPSATVAFTSGGSEANTTALTPSIAIAMGAPRDRLLVSAIEHPSVLAGGRFATEAVERIPVDGEGTVDLAWLERRLGELGRAGARPLVSLMAANNETGVIQPVAAAAEIVHRAGGLLHVDAVQVAGRIAWNMTELGADIVTLSAHKLGGPKGVGALIVRDEATFVPLVTGGGQERGHRAGTENVAGIAGFGAAAAAAREALADEQARTAALRNRLEDGVRAATSAAVIFGAKAERLPNTTLVAMPGARAETLVIAFDLDGIAVSAGAACSSGKVAPSHVLAAMGVVPALARAAIRVSLGPTTAEHDVDRFLEVWKMRAQSLSKEQRGLAA